ncbi:hypothetical protein ACFSQE_08445 [Vogesella fluminis]|uniref:hypothetical protein n=1 Tax=Vogesella fluminis TaxID=1069161 RepID=UPI00362CCEE1
MTTTPKPAQAAEENATDSSNTLSFSWPAFFLLPFGVLFALTLLPLIYPPSASARLPAIIKPA